jgi:regulatory protein
VPPGRRGRREGFADKRERLGAIDDPAVVLEAALRFLEPRQRSIGEVRRRLTRVGYQPELVEGAIARLAELGMLDDAAFARTWVESRDRARPRGERALRQELAQKGVERAVVDEVIGEREPGQGSDGPGQGSDGPSPDEAAAERLLHRHLGALNRVPDTRARRQRAYALLARNGFDPDVAGRLSARVASAADEPLDQPD